MVRIREPLSDLPTPFSAKRDDRRRTSGRKGKKDKEEGRGEKGKKMEKDKRRVGP